VGNSLANSPKTSFPNSIEFFDTVGIDDELVLVEKQGGARRSIPGGIGDGVTSCRYVDECDETHFHERIRSTHHEQE